MSHLTQVESLPNRGNDTSVPAFSLPTRLKASSLMVVLTLNGG